VAFPADRKANSLWPDATTKSSIYFVSRVYFLQNLQNQCEVKTQIELVSKDTSPLIFTARIRSASFPENPLQLLVELAEGIEPPTL
jgi:hypothetical protein